jgi:toxin ParE1/3/4
VPGIAKSEAAENDLLEVWGYIAKDNPTAADAVLDMLDEKLFLLAEQPEMGRLREELARKLRSFPVGSYVIFYRPVPGGIKVERVLHSSQDITPVFFDPPQ